MPDTESSPANLLRLAGFNPTTSPWIKERDQPSIVHYQERVLRVMHVLNRDGVFSLPGTKDRYIGFLDVVGKTLIEGQFEGQIHQYEPDDDDRNREVKEKVLITIRDISDMFPLVPNLVWHAIAHIAVREDPFQRYSLVNEHHFAVGDAKDNDTALHALCMVTGLMDFVQDSIETETGYRILHACKCDCCIVFTGKKFDLKMPNDEDVTVWTDALFTHLLAEGVKTKALGLPFAFEADLA